jgi:hypothetical protein
MVGPGSGSGLFDLAIAFSIAIISSAKLWRTVVVLSFWLSNTSLGPGMTSLCVCPHREPHFVAATRAVIDTYLGVGLIP